MHCFPFAYLLGLQNSIENSKHLIFEKLTPKLFPIFQMPKIRYFSLQTLETK